MPLYLFKTQLTLVLLCLKMSSYKVPSTLCLFCTQLFEFFSNSHIFLIECTLVACSFLQILIIFRDSFLLQGRFVYRKNNMPIKSINVKVSLMCRRNLFCLFCKRFLVFFTYLVLGWVFFLFFLLVSYPYGMILH